MIENCWLVLIGADKIMSLFFEVIQVLLATVCSKEILAVGYSPPYIFYQLLVQVYVLKLHSNRLPYHKNIQVYNWRE